MVDDLPSNVKEAAMALFGTKKIAKQTTSPTESINPNLVTF
jgi:hypothetical protein